MKLIPYNRPYLGDNDKRALVECLDSLWLTTGPQTEKLEKALEVYCGGRKCVPRALPIL